MDIFDTNVLVGVVRNLKIPPMFLLDRFFPGIVESTSEYITIDLDVGKRRLAPFCSPVIQGKLVEARAVQSNMFKPAYLKDRRAPDLKRPVRRMIGERIGGDLTGPERELANLQFEIEDQVQMVNRRLVWMAAQALMAGSVTVAGEGYPSTVVNFMRSSDLTIALAGAARWSQTGTVPSDNIETWSTLLLKHSGAVMTDLIFTTTPWSLFRGDQKVKDSIWFPRSGDSNVELGGGVKNGAVFKGIWGSYNLWLYNDWYIDATDTEQPMIPDGYVIGVSEDLQGTRAFGAILDPNFNYASLAYAPKSWVEQDPAQRIILMQSSPLVIPSRVNACFGATVI
jgi:hypothetical protein